MNAAYLYVKGNDFPGLENRRNKETFELSNMHTQVYIVTEMDTNMDVMTSYVNNVSVMTSCHDISDNSCLSYNSVELLKWSSNYVNKNIQIVNSFFSL